MVQLRQDWRDRIATGVYRRLPAFKSRNFRLYVVGQVFSLSGTFMTQIAVPWLIYDLTKSVWLLGVAGFFGFLPALLLTPWAGVLSDRWNRQKLLEIVQVCGISISGTLCLLTFLGWINYEILLFLSILGGLLKGIDIPIRHAFVIEMVEHRPDLANAIALNSVMLSSSRLLGPAMGGVLIATVGVQYCFLYDSLSYLAAIAALSAMQLPRRTRQPSRQTPWQGLQEGWRYASSTPPIRAILLLLAVQGVFGISYMPLLPVFAVDILKGGAETLGFLSAAAAVGGAIACVYLSLRREIAGLERAIAICPAMIGVGLILFALSRDARLSLLILLAVGGSATLQVASSNTLIQTLVEDDKRGRVMSFYSLSLIGMMPLSNLLAGSLAHLLGAPLAAIACGCVCILGSLRFRQCLPLLTEVILQATASNGKSAIES